MTEITDDGEALSFKDIEVPVDPVIGTIGVATSEESMSTLTPHDHGGNLDTTDMTTGTTAYFPVFQDGAMLAMGDSKAAMADGEMCGTGAEIGTEIDVTVSVISDAAVDLERPLVDTGDAWKTIASAETMEDAVKTANEDLIGLLAAEHEYTLTDATSFRASLAASKSAKSSTHSLLCGTPFRANTSQIHSNYRGESFSPVGT